MTSAKRFQTFVAAMALFAAVVAPIAASASTAAAKGFCSRLLSVKAADKATARLEQMQSKLKTRRGEVTSFVASRRASRDGALVESRNQLKDRRDAALGKMDEIASAPVQKEAVTTFRVAVQSAIETRQTALDAATKVFRAGLDKVRTDRQTAVDTAIEAFHKAVQDAETKAKADCSLKDADSEKIRAAMTSAIETARQTMKNAIREAEKVGERAPTLAQARQAAFEKALSDYRAALEKAKDDFKAAVGSN